MITIFKGKTYTPIIFNSDEYANSTKIDLSKIGLISRWKTLKEVSTTEENLDNKIILCRDLEFRFYKGVLIVNAYYMLRHSIISICEDKDKTLYALVFNELSSASVKTTINKFIAKYGVKRKNIKLLNFSEMSKEILFPINVTMDDWEANVQKEMSNKFIKSKRQLNG